MLFFNAILLFFVQDTVQDTYITVNFVTQGIMLCELAKVVFLPATAESAVITVTTIIPRNTPRWP